MEEQKKSHVARNVTIAIVIVVLILGLLTAGIIGFVIFFRNIINNSGIEEKANKVVSELKEEVREPKNTENSIITPNQNETIPEDTTINIGGYNIVSGTYIGYETMFDWEAQKEYKVEIKVTITKDTVTMDGHTTSYSVSGNQIIINGLPVVQAVGTNRLQSLAQSMPDLIYQGY